jgi:hypothetical protein
MLIIIILITTRGATDKRNLITLAINKIFDSGIILDYLSSLLSASAASPAQDTNMKGINLCEQGC